MPQRYDYANREGTEEVSWPRFAELAEQLAGQLATRDVDVIIGIARGGLFPATFVAAALRCEMYPVRITRRVNDRVVYDRPVWKVDVTSGVAGRRVAVIDEMADSGETLEMVAKRALERGAESVVTASLFAHTWADPMPEEVARVSDALVIFPWDARVLVDGAWQLHPELAQAIALQAAADEAAPDAAESAPIDDGASGAET
jgi:hypoxanthine phosphoribosyltransferase